MSEHQTPQAFDPSESAAAEHEGVQPQPLQLVARMTVRYVQMGKGHLKIYARTVNDVPVMEAFTLASLADCLGLPAGTIEGRYHRGRLFNWKLDIPTGESRPVRGFPLQMLEQVITILTTRGARVEGAGTNEERVARAGPSSARFPLKYETHAGKRYITIPALADHYGVSVTTIRNKLTKAGMLGQAVNLSAPAQGGRPRRGFRESQYSQLVDSIENGAQYLNEVEQTFRRATQPAQLPAGNPVVDWARHRQAERVIAQARQPQVVDTELAAHLEGLLKKSKPMAGQAPNPETAQPLQLWVTRLREAPEIWQRDAVIDAMVRAGMTAGMIQEAVTLADSAPAGAERSGIPA